MADRPATLPTWATDPDTTVAPSSGQQAAGFAVGSRPPARWFNWLFHWLSAWVAYVSDGVFTGKADGEPGVKGKGTGAGGGVQGVGGDDDGVGGEFTGGGAGDGVCGTGGEDGGVGVKGTSATSYGVHGKGITGVLGEALTFSGFGVLGTNANNGSSADNRATAVKGKSTGGYSIGVYGAGETGVYGSGTGTGVAEAGVAGSGALCNGVMGTALVAGTSGTVGINDDNGSVSEYACGVWGQADGAYGRGVNGLASGTAGVGVMGSGTTGVKGVSVGSGDAVLCDGMFGLKLYTGSLPTGEHYGQICLYANGAPQDLPTQYALCILAQGGWRILASTGTVTLP